ncbi:hypothetical protein L484_008573 [Morus notabilis]|uniref:Uncharacterized protein n=1 Tax=Morus notabilis TaxID=981085 RepID=W9R5I9_9ROSA|nr:hypothetical protein L484_008573 [Morus notabilis]
MKLTSTNYTSKQSAPKSIGSPSHIIIPFTATAKTFLRGTDHFDHNFVKGTQTIAQYERMVKSRVGEPAVMNSYLNSVDEWHEKLINFESHLKYEARKNSQMRASANLEQLVSLDGCPEEVCDSDGRALVELHGCLPSNLELACGVLRKLAQAGSSKLVYGDLWWISTLYNGLNNRRRWIEDRRRLLEDR